MIAEQRAVRGGASLSFRPSFLPPPRGVDDAGLLMSREEEPNEWAQRIDDLRDIRRLEDDWDGMGAKAPAVELVDSAIQLAILFRDQGADPPSRVVPGLNGTVLFEWQYGKTYCEIEVTRPYYAEGLILTPGQETEHWVIAGG